MHLSLQQKLTITLLIAFGILLMFWQIPIIPLAPYLTISLADLPSMLITMRYNHTVGIITATGIACGYWLCQGLSIIAGIGILASFLFNIVMLSLFYYHHRLHLFTASIITTFIMSMLDYLLIFPLYIGLFNLHLPMTLFKMIIVVVMPFNFIKSSLISFLIMFISKHLTCKNIS